MACKKCTFGKVLFTGVGILAVAGVAAAAGIAAGLKKWAADEDSDDIKLVFGAPYGVKISKGSAAGSYSIDTRYDWKNDPEFADYLDEDVIPAEPTVVTEAPAEPAAAEPAPAEPETPAEPENPNP